MTDNNTPESVDIEGPVPIETTQVDLSEFGKRGTEVFPQTPIQAAPAGYTPSAPTALLDPPAVTDSSAGAGESNRGDTSGS